MSTPAPRRSYALAIAILLVGVALALLIVLYRPAPDAPAADAPAPEAAMEQVDEVAFVTWNVYNFGRSKDDVEIAFIAEQLRGADLVALQEISTSPAGAQAVARLDDALDRMGAAWDYVISDPTSGRGSERYAFLWKPSRVRLEGRAWLEASLADTLDREPFLARFSAGGRTLLVASFHAVPTARKPARENALLSTLHAGYPDDHLVIAGDFNLPARHSAFDALRTLGYEAVLARQRTSIKHRRNDAGEHLANEYDNIFVERTPLYVDTAGVLDFTGAFPTLREARMISDHLPVYAEIGWRAAAP